MAMAASRLSRVVRMSFSDSSSTRPTGYVSLRSAWTPGGWVEHTGKNIERSQSMRRTIIIERDI